ncbi:MAG: hypothetical protein HYW89_00070 [Candidatus Sungiibacteriota bacterium]|uniref:Uncharacterized protein n=1 Tax=Candidatus Sungiibacteriota bacterium TaxID=2750080 RepID=A0A7T5RJI9_9BACT|nr:MAG: hypothetical protein HYW89_00070 [Candidatus Sungbacteria bacterium]
MDKHPSWYRDLIYIAVFGFMIGLLFSGCAKVNVNATDWRTLKPQDFPPLVIDGVTIPLSPDLLQGVENQAWIFEDYSWSNKEVLRKIRVRFYRIHGLGWRAAVELEWQLENPAHEGLPSYYAGGVYSPKFSGRGLIAGYFGTYILTPQGWNRHPSSGTLLNPTGFIKYPTSLEDAKPLVESLIKESLKKVK